ncbi:MAG: 3-phosphoshikimate 1-carboxyvinyltransferase [Frankiales bacterium]|nr:3-phosphoshikimate 1-carboxyvinyltransferase [Frankiales bacterium]
MTYPSEARTLPTDWVAPFAREPVRGTVALPGSKSLTNRALVLAALSQAPTRITAPLRARDTHLMVNALRGLDVAIADDGADWIVTPADPQASIGGTAADHIDCGLAGTVMRFVPAVAALTRQTIRFDGDEHARSRPMRTLLEGLRQAGADIDDGGTGRLPFTVRGHGSLPGGRVDIDSSASSQFLSALLLAGARFDHGLDLRHIGQSPAPSLRHIAMTVTALRDAGVMIDDSEANRWVVRPGALQAPDTVIEPDLSNAAPFLAAALVTGGQVTVPLWPAVTTQAGDALRDLLVQLGAEVVLSNAGLTVQGTGEVKPLVADLGEVSELTPVVAAICAVSKGESRLTGVAHIRGHETDRLAALATELNAVGSDVTELADGLLIRPGELRAARWHAYADHRMAQAGAVLGLVVPGLRVDDIAATTKTMADFPGLWTQLLNQAPAA